MIEVLQTLLSKLYIIKMKNPKASNIGIKNQNIKKYFAIFFPNISLKFYK